MKKIIAGIIMLIFGLSIVSTTLAGDCVLPFTQKYSEYVFNILKISIILSSLLSMGGVIGFYQARLKRKRKTKSFVMVVIGLVFLFFLLSIILNELFIRVIPYVFVFKGEMFAPCYYE